MLELAAALIAAFDAGHAVAVATVTRIDGSAPRTLGTAIAVLDDGTVIGSISGGCVEGAVYEACQEVLATGVAERCEFGYSDDDAFAVGLACGGRIEVIVQRLGGAVATGAGGLLVQRLGGAVATGAGEVVVQRLGGAVATGAGGLVDGALRAELEAAAAGRPAGVALIVGGEAFGEVIVAGEEGDGELREEQSASTATVASEAPVSSRSRARRVELLQGELAARIAAGRGGLATMECDGERVEALFVVTATAPRLIIFGAVDFSAALANAAVLLGYRVTVCDARPVFTTPERFPTAEKVVVEWPSTYLANTEVDARTVVCVLTHDDKFDIPLLEVALRLPVAYVGAMGSRRTHDRRMERLVQTVAAHDLERLHSPIGLDIGASTPQETALSILAEVVSSRQGASGVSLRQTDGPIHRTAAVYAATGI